MSEIKRAVFKPYNGHPQIDADLYAKADAEYRRDLERERDELRAEIERLREAIFWACGMSGSFPSRRDGQGQFWWRRGLRERAGISVSEINQRAMEADDE